MTHRLHSVCFFTQTPYTRLIQEVHSPDGALDLSQLKEGEHHLPSPGGVTRMIRALSAAWAAAGHVGRARWISLASSPTPSLRIGGTTIDHVSLDEGERAAYARAKGDFWNALHGLAEDVDLQAIDAGLTHLARAMAMKAADEHARSPFDLFYVHDFQLMRLAKHLPAGVPVAFRWHGPVRRMTPEVEAYLASCLDEFDLVIVHTEAYAEELRRMGVRVPVHASYPYVPEPPAIALTQADLDAFDARFGLAPDDVAFTLVARLDPIKSQDVAIRALAKVLPQAPQARLLLVGGGGFSAGRGGLGMGHAVEWRDELARLARELGVADRVTFTGGILDRDLEAAYARSRAVLLPSRVEGFGLAPVEAWQRGVPVVVSTGTAVSELVTDGEDGFTFPADDVDALTAAMGRLAADEAAARRMGRAGRETARACSVERGARDVWRIVSPLLLPRAAPATPRRVRAPGSLTLVTDLDRTLTGPDLLLDERARRMLRELRAAGVRIVLATGRPLVHVVQMGLRELTDALVVENGAIVVDSRTRETHVMGGSFPRDAERALGDLAPRFEWHRVMGSGPRALADGARRRLRAAGVEHHVEFNGDEVMLLPPGVDKGTGALAAFRVLGVRFPEVWAIGDGENDVPLFRIARQSAAPSQAPRSVASEATMPLKAPYAAGFVEFAKRLLRDPGAAVDRRGAAPSR